MTVIELFEKAVNSYPGASAVRFGDQVLTYTELDLESNRLANYLLFKGIHKNDRVAIVLERGVNIIVSLLAVLKCGASYIPVDPHYPKDRVAFMIEDADAQFIITSLTHVNLFDNERVNTIVLDEAGRELERCSLERPDIEFGPETIAYILYTSGSTGKPKGAMVTHRNLAHFLKGMQNAFNITAQSRFLSVSSISFDASCFDNYLCLVNGAELVLTSNEIIKDGQLLLNEIEKRNISIILATPITFKLMLAASWDRKIPVTLLSAGEVLLPALAKELLPRCKALYNVYGPTETTVICTLTRILSDNRITIGAAIADTPIYILDDQMKPVEEGETGEIFIGGDGVSNGYWKREELTQQRFIPDPFSAKAGARMYRSGDLGRRKKNGEIKYEGRVDNQVKIRGFRIELGEIEYHLSRLHHVRDVATTVHEDQHGEKNIVAYIISDLEEGKDDSWFKKRK
nr:amino acid adenylation domain-containing protein [Niabella hibiscisoli]